MSRKIDPHKVLTEEERTYALARNMHHVLVENAKWLKAAASDKEAAAPADEEVNTQPLESLTNYDLNAIIQLRGLKPLGTRKEDLIRTIREG